MRDPGFLGRLLKAFLTSMLIAAVFGIPVGATAFLVPSQSNATVLHDALLGAGNVSAIVFWAAFIQLFVTQVYKTEAALDFDRRVRLAEELFANGGRRR